MGKNIFIVEDNFLYTYVLEKGISEYGNFNISTYTTGEACLQNLQDNPDLIILDYNLDDEMNGYQVFKQIHKQKPNVPVIILSSQEDIKVVADLLNEGVFDYIQKKDKEKAMIKLKDSILKALKISAK